MFVARVLAFLLARSAGTVSISGSREVFILVAKGVAMNADPLDAPPWNVAETFGQQPAREHAGFFRHEDPDW